MAPSSKTQQISQISGLLKQRSKAEPAENRLSILEAVVLGICREGSTADQANQVLSRIKDHFFDWNEVRVSTIKEIVGVLVGLPNAEHRANTIRTFLRQLFTKTYGFNLDALTKKPLKESLKTLQEYDALQSDYVLATVVQRALGGHAIPIADSSRRALVRLGATETDVETSALRSTLERVIAKAQGCQFQEAIEQLCQDTCTERNPDCPHCILREICPTGLGETAVEKPTSKKPKKGKSLAQINLKLAAQIQTPILEKSGKKPKGKSGSAAPVETPQSVKAAEPVIDAKSPKVAAESSPAAAPGSPATKKPTKHKVETPVEATPVSGTPEPEKVAHGTEKVEKKAKAAPKSNAADKPEPVSKRASSAKPATEVQEPTPPPASKPVAKPQPKKAETKAESKPTASKAKAKPVDEAELNGADVKPKKSSKKKSD